MMLFEIIEYLFIFNFFIILVEFLFSLYRTDNVYSIKGTLGNILNGVILNLLSHRLFGFYLIVFVFIKYYVPFNFDSHFNFIQIVLCLLFVDFMYYIFHRLHHRFYFLWVFHFIHHSDNNLNLSTALRISWIEQFYIYIFLLPLVFVGFPITLIFVCFYILSEYQFYCHSQYLKLPLFFDYIFITPNNHKIHHDSESRHQSSNYGGVFSIWDRLFGTYINSIDIFRPGIQNIEEHNFIRYQLVSIYKFVIGIWKNLFSKHF